MFIAKHEQFDHILKGSQVTSRIVLRSRLTCPACGDPVEYNPSAEHVFEYFHHADGSSDCFESDGASDGHRLAVEVAMATIYNRLKQVTGSRVEIDIERWVGGPSKFVIADVRVSSPLRITAEIFFRSRRLSLRRRMKTLSKHNYRAFLIFHTGGVHDVSRIERYMQRISPLSVGHFNPDSMDIVLGDLFSREQLNFSAGTDVPDYMV